MSMSLAIMGMAKNMAMKQAQEFVKKKVIERWSQYRADKFYEAFLYEVAKQADSKFQSASLDDLLEKIGKRDTATSAIWDAYRHVCLSASKEIGPRVIGLLVAEIVQEDRTADESEERLFQAAENLTDADFESFIEFLKTAERHSADSSFGHWRRTAEPIYLIDKQEAWADYEQGALESPTPINLGDLLGLWAARLRSLGIVLDDRVEHTEKIREDSERYIDSDQRYRVIRDFLVISKDGERLARLVERAMAIRTASDLTV
ncbi:hypothetical protein [Burkholderia gladioli]|jgi:hypothetical protein|uniref:hypothetical protein n=1 Tax=Burkholderia gladioli TaxID=28095 RepID=UPI00163FC146|nr:hypothetical protein [Burkholderia gladioli]MBU9643535.1 hypothetical protein [Burkholderia gladioli]